jgi:hypothetical protein
MAWFKHLALVLLAALPRIAALPVIDDNDNSISVEGRYIITLQNNISTPDLRNHMSRVAAIQYRNSDNHMLPNTGIEKSYAIGEFRAYVGAFDLDTLQMIRNDTRVSKIALAMRFLSDTRIHCVGSANRARHNRQSSLQGFLSAQRTLGPRNIVQLETKHGNLQLR